jgi:hypothetical protein
MVFLMAGSGLQATLLCFQGDKVRQRCILEQAFNKQHPDTVYPVLGSNVLVESFYIAGNWLEDELI